MDEAEYDMKYYVDRRGRHMPPRIQRLWQITPRCTSCVGQLLNSFEIRTNVFFKLIFFVFSCCLCR